MRCATCFAICVGAGQHDHEFLAAEARDQVAAAHARLQCLRAAAQHAIADRRAVALVDVLEVIEIDVRDAQVAAEHDRLGEFAIEQCDRARRDSARR